MPFLTVPLPLFVLTTSGLEAISAREIARLPGVSINAISYRRISATCSGSLTSLLTLRTVDDVFLEIATWTDIGRSRGSLAQLRLLGSRLDLHAVAICCARLRPVPMCPMFSVTASFVGKRNYSSEEIKAVLADEIAKKHGWTYQQDDRVADLNIRLFIEHEVAIVGVRLSKTALHDRWYQQVHLPGGLKPSVAAALVELAQITPNTIVLDPCCGGGTILIEAALQGAIVCGGDNNPDALAVAQTNIAAAGVEGCLHCWNAQALPLADGSIDRIICNLPWGRQVQVEDLLTKVYQCIVAEMRRVLTPTGRIVLLTSAPHDIDPLDLRLVEQCEISLFGQRPTILLLSPL
jgi:tRNA (guanine6-N2)-methyltransferase